MAAATNTTLGEIKLSGDLLASNANAPTLRPSGVKSGTYNVTDKIYVDAQGRITWAKQLPEDFAWPGATKTEYGVFQIGVTPDPNNNSIDISSGVISVNKATATDAGVVKIGSGLLINGTSDATEVNVPEATSLVFGACRPDNTTTEVDVNGTLSIIGQALIDDAGPASVSNLGAVKVGARLSITDGVLNTDWDLATGASLGTVIVGDNFSVNAGVLSANEASTTVNGVIQVSDSFWIDPSDLDINIRQTHYNYWGHLYGISGPNIFLDDPTSTLSCNYSFNDFSGDATASVLGKVQVGDRINVDGNGVISVPLSSDTVHGVFKVTGRTFKVVNNALTYDRNYPASATYYGHVKPDGNTIVFSDQPTSTIAANFDGVAAATTFSKGSVIIGDNIQVSSGIISIAPASNSVAGIVKPGSNMSVNNQGVLTADFTNAPTGSKSTLGLVTIQGFNRNHLYMWDSVLDLHKCSDERHGVLKIDPNDKNILGGGGSALRVDFSGDYNKFVYVKPGNYFNLSNSILSANIPTSSTTVLGKVKPDNATITIDNSGTLDIVEATTFSKGVAGAGRGLWIYSKDANGLINGNFEPIKDSILGYSPASSTNHGICRGDTSYLGTMNITWDNVLYVDTNNNFISFDNRNNLFTKAQLSRVEEHTQFENIVNDRNLVLISPLESSEELQIIEIESYEPDPLIDTQHICDFTSHSFKVVYSVINKTNTNTPVRLQIINKYGTDTVNGIDSPVMGEGCTPGDIIVFEYIRLPIATGFGLFFKSATIYRN